MKPTSKDAGKTQKPQKAETLKEKVRRHVNDKNDKITEEDLRDVIVGTQAVDVEHPDEPTVQKNDLPKKKKSISSWDVLEDGKGND